MGSSFSISACIKNHEQHRILVVDVPTPNHAELLMSKDHIYKCKNAIWIFENRIYELSIN